MFTRGCGLEVLLLLCGLELSASCPRHCICYTAPSTVSCQAHNFQSVPEDIPPDSERIFLQNNRIGELLRGHFHPTTAVLWLYSNNISFIEHSTFLGFQRLEDLDLGDNRHLRTLSPDTFRGLGQLSALNLNRCGLSSLASDIFQGLHSLRYLYLQDNHLDFLEDDLFVDLLNLSHLFLHGNRLWSLHQNTFRGLGELDRLLLHHNRLQWVERLAFHDLRRLTTLYLFNNSLAHLPADCLAQLPALEYLRLNDNPWECDCGALSLWEWLRRFRGSTSAVACHAPPHLCGKDLKQLRRDEFPECTGSLSRHQSQGRHHPHLLHRDQQHVPPASPRPLPSALPPQRTRRFRNCTQGRSRGEKERELDKKPSYLGVGEANGDPSGSPPRRRHKCPPQSTVRPPSGVQKASNKATRPSCVTFLLVAFTVLILR